MPKQLPKIDIPAEIIARLPQDSLVRSLAEGRPIDFSDRVKDMASVKINERINSATASVGSVIGVLKK